MIKEVFLSSLFLLMFAGCGSSTTSHTTDKFQISALISPGEPVSPAQKIVLNSSKELDSTTINNETIYIVDLNSSERVGLYLGFGNNSYTRVIVTPYRYLDPLHSYTLVATDQLRATDGSHLDNEYGVTFNTVANSVSDTTPPTLRETKPHNGESNILVESDIVVDFDEFVSSEMQYAPNGEFSVSYEATDGTPQLINGDVLVFNSLIRFQPREPLPYDSNISVTFSGTVEDMFGNTTSLEENFSFQTRTQSSSPKSNEGFKVLATDSLGENGAALSLISNNITYSKIAVSSDDSLHIYDVNYTVPTTGLPGLSHKSSIAVGSKIVSMVAFNSRYLLAGTMSDGIYVFEINPTTSQIIQKEHFLAGKSVYGVSVGAPQYNSIDRAYAVGPEFGLQVFDLNATTAQMSPLFDVNSTVLGTALDIKDETSYDNVALTDVRKLYIADYDGNVVTLDENGSLLQKTNISCSVKKLAVREDYNGNLGLMAICSSGKMQGVDFNGSMQQFVKGSLVENVSDTSSYSDSYNMNASIFYSLGKKGIEASQSDYIEHFIKSVESISNDVIYAQGNFSNSYYLASLSENGDVNILNALFDDVNPSISYSTPSDGATGVSLNKQIEIDINDVYLNQTTLIKDNFTIKDENTSSLVNFSLSGSSELTLALVPDSNLSPNHLYRVIVSSNIEDQLGNKLGGGVDQNISFTTTLQ